MRAAELSPPTFCTFAREVVLTMMPTADSRLVGTALLVFAIIPFGDMSIILGSGGSRSRAFSIHGVTCAVMLVVGLLLIHAI